MEKPGASHSPSPKHTPASENVSVRRSRIIFTVFFLILTIFLIWPGYSLFSSAEPLILGLPLSFAWVTFCTIVGFIALLFLYVTDIRREEAD
jgi:TRAP-type C4-dicarboxylate transport system permease small subunit